MNEPSDSRKPGRTAAEDFEEALATVKSLADGISDMQRRLEELRREMPEAVLLVTNKYVYRLFDLADKRDELDVDGFLAVHEISRLFSEFLTVARRFYESGDAGAEKPFLCIDQELHVLESGRDDPELLRHQEELHKAWPKNVLQIAKLHVYDTHKLVKGKRALGLDDFLKVYTDALAFFGVLEAEKKHLDAGRLGTETRKERQ